MTGDSINNRQLNLPRAKNSRLRLVELSDAQFILDLRLNQSRAQFLRPVANDVELQVSWLSEYKHREANGADFYFVIEDLSQKPLGLIRVYDLKSDSFSWGSWATIPEAPKTAGIESILMVYEFGFYNLDYPATHFEVMKSNAGSNRFHRRFGARLSSENKAYYYYHLERKSYQDNGRKKYKRYLEL